MQQHSTEQKNRLRRNFIAALDLLDTLQREPDRWEEECLSYALSAMASGLYLVAEVELEAFGRPIDQRPRELVAALEAKPRRFTKALLRQGFEFMLKSSEQPDLETLPAFAVLPPEIRAPL
ncbi:MAG TPA: hypothetical protein VFB13_21000 [Reyranella sp.]|jgi:hypothetical protein|nr:hypothetical protein [Reyranella sp.]